MPRSVNKVTAYITWHDRVLIFSQPASPEAGVQVPSGTMEAGEEPAAAVMREAYEETGLDGLQLAAYLGREDSTYTDKNGHEVTSRRHFFHLRFSGQSPQRWRHWEETPSGDVDGPILFELWWATFDEAKSLVYGRFATLLHRLQGELDPDR